MKTTRTTPSPTATVPSQRVSAAWAWWGVPAAITGLAGNFISTHGALSEADATQAADAVSRTSYHVGTVLGLTSFACLVLASAGWRRWGSGRGLAQQAVSVALAVTATLVLFATGLRGALAEYLPGGINADNFDDAGLYALFIVHDTAPWTAWWGVLMMAAVVAFISLAGQGFSRWLGVLSVAALAMPIAVMAGSGALAGAGFVGPIWLAIFSVIVALRGVSSRSDGH
ncbi:hypothetical protein [Nocardioides bizhenqiangii]|uniref:DUF4386 family protein n=1 Tax=Nocardioides bizhenqiangii TaxID=3095076 RepID=A0ABZ0ZQ76_9ACTN|nr:MULTISPECIES: hypothetical protein [unclassified Nocardioides]MDZ5619888.1 hypothetical protein [Nocardioides sp. HM23]WQQ26106.1 hypothetical protein SHK19_19350 [Nocardioides sp. HM61]